VLVKKKYKDDNGSKKIRTQQIDNYVLFLKKEQPVTLERELKIMYLRAMAKKLDSSVIENNITMQEIVDEVNKVRKERYEKQTPINIK
jgi:transcriptional/translational regulatory protein YebC/TACO1